MEPIFNGSIFITLIYSLHIQATPPPSLEIESNCDSSWNSGVLSGTFRAIGGLAHYTIYAKDTPDGNGNFWYLYFDQNIGIWKFSYAGAIPKPGDNLSKTVDEEIVSEYDPGLQGQY